MHFNKDYFIGLDCGTESVGFAVTDTEYNILKFNGKAMWGAHLFDEAKTAQERRVQRCARRKTARRKERIKLVQSIFSKEIDKIDPTFFIRLNDSSLYTEDKREKQSNSLFNDETFKDKDFFKRYPTFFHLRTELIKSDVPHDVRLVYLAIQHIIKNRGHFLFPGETLNAALNLSAVLTDFADTFIDIFESDIKLGNHEEFEESLRQRTKGIRKEKLQNLIDIEDGKLKNEIIKLLIGNKVKAEKLFYNEEYKELKDIDFSSASFEEQILPELEATLSSDEFRFIELAKSLYDWAILAFVMSGYATLSEAKVALYESNHNDLMLLKKVAKRYLTESEYEIFFHSDTKPTKSSGKGSFSNYIGEIQDGKRRRAVIKCTTDEFYKEVRAIIAKADQTDLEAKTIREEIDNDAFLPLLISFRNGAVPYQINLMELKMILEKAAVYLPFLTKKDEDGLTPSEKLISLMRFRIPYYVGPLGYNKNNQNTWMVRKKEGKILPWNFDEIVDTDASAEGFIKRMTSKCTYLPSEDVIPRNSLLYSQFLVLNDLNNLRVNGEKLETDKKHEIYHELFESQKKVTQSKLKKYLKTKKWCAGNDIIIEGIDGDFKSSLSSYIDFKPYIETGKLKRAEVENIIKWLTLFGEGGNMAEKRIRNAFKDKLSEEEIRRISHLKYSGWGRFSEKFLSQITAKIRGTDEYKSIITLLWDTEDNLMEIINKHEFIELHEDRETIEKLNYKNDVENLYVSPAVKRQIWQTLRIVDEIEKIMGKPPKKVFIEVTREKGKKNDRKESRKNTLLSIMKNKKKELPTDIEEIIHSLNTFEESDISKRDKLYLYFTQCGKCMYSGRPIDISDIGTAVDIDHIYPYSQSDDNSLTNKVLVYSEYNREKTNDYPIKEDIRKKMGTFWKTLKDSGLIPKEKYERLIRATPLTENELETFINRQLIETSQNVKATATILKQYFGEKTKIVYSKARKVSDFRDKFKIYKSRSVNSLHHAHDAYLNIVVGNIFDIKYSRNFFIHKNGKGYYNLSKPFDYTIENAWIAGEDGTIKKVKQTLRKNNILFTRQQITNMGQLFDLNLVKAGSKNGVLPAKLSNPVLQEKLKTGDKKQILEDWTRKYGGYNSLSTAYFALIKYEEKGKEYAQFIPISIIDSNKLSKKEKLSEYCTTELGIKNPKIIYPVLKINSLIKINGYLLNIVGKSNGGAIITLKNAIPLYLSNSLTNYVKKIEKFIEKKAKIKDYRVNCEHDKLNTGENIELYKELCTKAKQNIYLNRPGCQTKTIKEGMDKFISLSIEDQCDVLYNLILYYGMNTGLCNLVLIGGKKKTGTLTCASKIDLSKKKLSIINQSITGLFSEEVEIN